jgi:DNA polymerase I-like protein with 3'-5' exonuclease and polymerase domains
MNFKQFPDIQRFPHIALDTETDGIAYPTSRVFGFSLSTPDGKDYYWDVREYPDVLDILRIALWKYKGTVIFHNASFDLKMLSHERVAPPANVTDTVIMASLVNEHLPSYSLDYLARVFLGEGKLAEIYDDLAAIFGGRATRNVQMPNLHRAPSDVVGPYAMRDTRITLRLYEKLMEEVANQDLWDILEFELSLFPPLLDMEMRGIRVDIDYAEKAAGEIDILIDQKQREIDQLFGAQVNVNSSPQIRKLFEPTQSRDGVWRAIDGTELEKTGKGNPSVDANALRRMTHPGAAMILDQRSLIKTANTFLRGHVIGSAVNGRVYPTINQSKGEEGGTGTGRLSYQSPAMQQIPSRNKQVASIVKPCFLPDEGHVWVDADLHSFEVRVFAHLAWTSTSKWAT